MDCASCKYSWCWICGFETPRGRMRIFEPLHIVCELMNEMNNKLKYRKCLKMTLIFLMFIAYLLSPAILAIIFVLGFIAGTFVVFVILCVDLFKLEKKCGIKRADWGTKEYLIFAIPTLM